MADESYGQCIIVGQCQLTVSQVEAVSCSSCCCHAAMYGRFFTAAVPLVRTPAVLCSLYS